MKKLVCIINGKGGAGKDTVCEFAAKIWSTRNISSITPILEVAKCAGWDGVKTKQARRFLSRLKEVCTEFNDLSFSYCVRQYEAFQQSEETILFMHIRETEEIARMKAHIGAQCMTLLVRRDQVESAFGNRSDDLVEHYSYDAILENNGTLETLQQGTIALLEHYLSDCV